MQAGGALMSVEEYGLVWEGAVMRVEEHRQVCVCVCVCVCWEDAVSVRVVWTSMVTWWE